MSIEKVLVADDEPLSREFLAESLEQRGCEVAIAADGSEALSKFSEADFDLVMTDLRMPGVDGLALLGRIKTTAPSVPVVLITAYGDVETAVSAMRSGAEDFLLKPFSPETLEAVISRLESKDRKSVV